MIKRSIAAACILLAACPALAQTGQKADSTEAVEYSSSKYQVKTNGFWSNWFVSAAGAAKSISVTTTVRHRWATASPPLSTLPSASGSHRASAYD